MPRKAFIADLQQATDNPPSDRVSDLKAGDDDGTFVFTYESPGNHTTAVPIHAHISDVGDYPSSHQYFVYTNSENVPPEVTIALSDVGLFDGMQVSLMLSKAAKILDQATAGSFSHPVCVDEDPMDIDSPLEEDNSDQELELEDEDEEDEEDNFDHGFDDAFPSISAGHRASILARAGLTDSGGDPEYNARIRSDLREVKNAGFHIGHLGNILDHGRDSFLIISIRVIKLGIPEDAMEAWHLDPKQYVLLLIHYTEGYRCLEELVAGRSASHSGVHMRVGLCQKQKVNMSEAIHAFSQLNDQEKKNSEQSSTINTRGSEEQKTAQVGLRRLFIGRPLDELLNDRLVGLLKYRLSMAFLWGGAEQYYNDHQGRNQSEAESVDSKYWAEESSQNAIHSPAVVTADHLSPLSGQKSFPLLAMQYFLRHLVRCTDFCLVCHCRVEAQWEALMPYVCDKPLCLYQYMALGFGPSIEYEIMTQPYVVDLLVSFCYCSTQAGALNSFPDGMSLTVPDPGLMPDNTIYPEKPFFGRYPRIDGTSDSSKLSVPKATQRVKPKTYKAKFDRAHDELIFPKDFREKPLRVGDWLCMLSLGRTETEHRRVLETLYPTVRVGPAIGANATAHLNAAESQYLDSVKVQRGVPRPSTLTPAATPPPLPVSSANLATSNLPEVEFVVYDQNFDDLTDVGKLISIRILLDILPSVMEMKTYLQSMGDKHMSLRAWTDRIPPAALGVLRWIIASNRSCLVQIDGHDDGTDKSEERISGMKDYMQFRFAQGAPDKEQRFTKAIRETSERLGPQYSNILKYPTIFAWHGSSLKNWHGIIREGLHFNEVTNGRAFGDGVYFSPQFTTSSGYSQFYQSSSNGSSSGWPKSQLKITQAICLNEIVNAPTEFVSKSPHLVIKQLDWIQTRYLFVQYSDKELLTEEKSSLQFLEQDPAFVPTGPTNKKIDIPIAAISKARRPTVKGVKLGHKKSKVQSPDPAEAITISDDSEAEDQAILLSESDDVVVRERDELVQEHERLGDPQQPTSKRQTGKGLVSLFSKALKGKQSGAKNMSTEASTTNFVQGTLDHDTLPMLTPPSYATPLATKALQRELKVTLKVQETHPAQELGWYLDPELVTNVYQWIVELHSFEAHLPLAQDMKSKGVKSVVLELRFGKGFPYSPPFVRVIRPRFLPFMMGGGGHVTAGGALCMELLTNSGWNPASNIEAVLLQVRLAISSTEPKPARLDTGNPRDYSSGEAVEAFKRACMAHGVNVLSPLRQMSVLTLVQWEVPEDFNSISQATLTEPEPLSYGASSSFA
ncbi:hypothetical protein MMC13_002376 [Lambiella insularis]|nr:hypothetical protein [Lambiella insularis]